MKQVLTTIELLDMHMNENTVILDPRPSAAYNGWPLSGEQRGGHIPGAISFPADWFNGFRNRN